MIIVKIVKYIFRNNTITKIPFFLIIGFSYQIFKRVSKKIISKKLFNKKSILLFPNCSISSMFTYTDIPDRKEIEILRKLATENTVFLDIGANIGSYSILLMDKVSKVIAFEPHPITANRCRMNFLLNNYSCKKVFEIALNNKVGKVFFTNDLKSPALNKISNGNRKNIIVKSDTLDNIAKKFLEQNKEYLIKVDVEGFEKYIFEGGRNFFTRYNISGIIFECFLNNRQEVFQILKNYNFKIALIADNNYIAQRN